jgi:hypothetical protein
MPAVPASPASGWRRLLVTVCAVALAVIAAPSTAGAFYLDDHEIDVASRTQSGALPSEIGNAASTLRGLSDDGRYALIGSTATNFVPAGLVPSGQSIVDALVYRKDRQTGALQLVARPSLYEGFEPELCGAIGDGDISGNGRYVAFSTFEPLVAADNNLNLDVYVRDMTKAIGNTSAGDEAGAWELVSAKDVGDVGAEYQVENENLEEACGEGFPRRGSQLPAGETISDDGRRVVFQSGSTRSDLPDRAEPDSPRRSLFWRDLDANRTWAVAREALDSSGDPIVQTDAGIPAGLTIEANLLLPLGAVAISGDGTKVAWSGAYGPSQVRVEEQEYGVLVNELSSRHLFWRNVSLGKDGVTRRVIPLIDFDDPGCTEEMIAALTAEELHDPEAEGPCYGPMIHAASEITVAFGTADLALGDDGLTVAFNVAGDSRPNPDAAGQQADVWVTSMAPGVSRKDGTRLLTKALGGTPDTSAAIGSVALSGNGDQVAFRTNRREFSSLTSPSPVGPLATESLLANVYRVTLPAGCPPQLLELASRGLDGDELDGSDGGSGVEISADGNTIAFDHAATNLAEGDTNGVDDVFVSRPLAGVTPSQPKCPGGGEEEEEPKPPVNNPDPPQGSPSSAPQSGPPSNKLTLLGKKLKPSNGTATISVSVPGPGALALLATANAPKAGASVAASAKGTFKVGSAAARASGAGTYRLTLKPSGRAKGVLREKGKLKVVLKITFTPVGGGPNTTNSSVTLKLKAG